MKTARLFGKSPDEVIFIGIKPEDISEGMELSPSVEEKIPTIIELVIKEINKESSQN